MESFNLDSDDVISMKDSESFLGFSTFKTLEMMVRLVSRDVRQLNQKTLLEWLDEGVSCEVLKTSGGGWQSGKVRISLEFIPDKPEDDEDELQEEDESQEAVLLPPAKPESPLDDLRTELNLNNE
jgi:hypothetical protein